MEPGYELNKLSAGQQTAIPALLFRLPEDNPQVARIDATQQLLFPTSAHTVCTEVGLNWWAALKLYQDGWLSFSPETTSRLDEAQEAELRFVGSLVLAGCDGSMLAQLLGGLARPYAYDAKRLYFDWASRRWRLLPDPRANPEATLTDWLERLVARKDIATLTGIGDLAHDALGRVRAQAAQPEETYSEQRHVTRDGEQTQG
jgi:hypothetical protein